MDGVKGSGNPHMSHQRVSVHGEKEAVVVEQFGGSEGFRNHIRRVRPRVICRVGVVEELVAQALVAKAGAGVQFLGIRKRRKLSGNVRDESPERARQQQGYAENEDNGTQHRHRKEAREANYITVRDGTIKRRPEAYNVRQVAESKRVSANDHDAVSRGFQVRDDRHPLAAGGCGPVIKARTAKVLAFKANPKENIIPVKIVPDLDFASVSRATKTTGGAAVHLPLLGYQRQVIAARGVNTAEEAPPRQIVAPNLAPVVLYRAPLRRHRQEERQATDEDEARRTGHMFRSGAPPQSRCHQIVHTTIHRNRFKENKVFARPRTVLRKHRRPSWGRRAVLTPFPTIKRSQKPRRELGDPATKRARPQQGYAENADNGTQHRHRKEAREVNWITVRDGTMKGRLDADDARQVAGRKRRSANDDDAMGRPLRVRDDRHPQTRHTS